MPTGSNSDPEIVYWQFAVAFTSEVTVPAVAVNVGAMLSATVTVASQLPVFPEASRTVSVTVWSPRSEQLNVLLLRVYTRLPCAVQLSDDPLFISAAVSVAVPELFK